MSGEPEICDYCLGGGLGGVDDGEGVVERGESAADCGLEERVVSAPQEQGLSLRSFVEGFGEVDLENFVGDGMVDPAFFDQGYQERAGFFVSFEAESVEGLGVGVRLDGSGGGEDEDVVCGGVGSRFR